MSSSPMSLSRTKKLISAAFPLKATPGSNKSPSSISPAYPYNSSWGYSTTPSWPNTSNLDKSSIPTCTSPRPKNSKPSKLYTYESHPNAKPTLQFNFSQKQLMTTNFTFPSSSPQLNPWMNSKRFADARVSEINWWLWRRRYLLEKLSLNRPNRPTTRVKFLKYSTLRINPSTGGSMKLDWLLSNWIEKTEDLTVMKNAK